MLQGEAGPLALRDRVEHHTWVDCGHALKYQGAPGLSCEPALSCPPLLFPSRPSLSGSWALCSGEETILQINPESDQDVCWVCEGKMQPHDQECWKKNNFLCVREHLPFLKK